MTPLEPGRRVSEHLELVRPLGRGAMGEVWVARHVNLDTEVAVKFVHRHNADDPEVRARFEVEAKAAARLKSPHVVQVFDHGVTDDGMPFLVMELLEGENLDDRLERETYLSPALAANILAQVAKALEVAHEHGVVHRDVKPGNIFLCPDGEGVFVKLLDFGVARAASMVDKKLTQSGVMIGTPSYISREMVVSPGPVDHRADLWALAVVAYEMITGDVPFTGDTVGLVCIAIAAGKPVPATTLAAVPPAVDAFFARAFAQAMESRFQTANELAAAFSSAIAGEAPTAIEPDKPSMRRSTSAAAETLPPRAELRSPERVSVEAMVSERADAVVPAAVDAVEAPGAPRRRWPWAVAALALIAVVVLLRSALVVDVPAPPPAHAAPPDGAFDASATAAIVEAAPTATPPAPTDAIVDGEGIVDGDGPPEASSEPVRVAPQKPIAPPSPPSAGSSNAVGRDDYGF